MEDFKEYVNAVTPVWSVRDSPIPSQVHTSAPKRVKLLAAVGTIPPLFFSASFNLTEVNTFATVFPEGGAFEESKVAFPSYKEFLRKLPTNEE
jgi:hypothetical protein